MKSSDALTNNNQWGQVSHDMRTDLLIFLHIVKTGGSSLRFALESQFSCRKILRCYGDAWNPDKMATLATRGKSQFQFFTSHQPFGTHRFFPQRATYLTMLREPTKRFISQYYAFVFPRPDWRKSRGNTLGEFIERIEVNRTDNRQVRFLADAMTEEAITQVHLDRAKKNLIDHFSAVGILERFNESLALFQKTYNWEKIIPVQRNVNSTKPTRPELTPEQRALLRKHHQYDKVLYEFATELFEAGLVSHQVSQADVDRIKQISRADLTLTYVTRAIRKIQRRFYRLH